MLGIAYRVDMQTTPGVRYRQLRFAQHLRLLGKKSFFETYMYELRYSVLDEPFCWAGRPECSHFQREPKDTSTTTVYTRYSYTFLLSRLPLDWTCREHRKNVRNEHMLLDARVVLRHRTSRKPSHKTSQDTRNKLTNCSQRPLHIIQYTRYCPKTLYSTGHINKLTNRSAYFSNGAHEVVISVTSDRRTTASTKHEST